MVNLQVPQAGPIPHVPQRVWGSPVCESEGTGLNVLLVLTTGFTWRAVEHPAHLQHWALLGSSGQVEPLSRLYLPEELSREILDSAGFSQ